MVGGEDFVSHYDGHDLGVGEVCLNVLLHPGLGFIRVGHLGQVLVAEGHGELEAGAGEGTEGLWIGVIELDFCSSHRLEERDDVFWGRKVVSDLAIVDADGGDDVRKRKESKAQQREEKLRRRRSHG